jgi:hypothetical protein
VFHHFLNDAMFLPERHENGNALLGDGLQFGIARPVELSALEKSPSQPAAGTGEVQHQIVEAIQQHPNREWNQADGHNIIDARGE